MAIIEVNATRVIVSHEGLSEKAAFPETTSPTTTYLCHIWITNYWQIENKSPIFLNSPLRSTVGAWQEELLNSYSPSTFLTSSM